MAIRVLPCSSVTEYVPSGFFTTVPVCVRPCESVKLVEPLAPDFIEGCGAVGAGVVGVEVPLTAL